MKLVILFLISLNFIYAADPLAAYKKDDSWFVIDEEGNELFRTDIIEKIEGYREGFFRIRIIEDDILKWAFMDINGKIILKPDQDEVFDFYEGVAMTAKDIPESEIEKLYGFMDINGNQIIPNILIDAISFSEGLAYIMDNQRRGYINTKGEMVLPLPDSLVGYPFSEGKAAVSNFDYQVGYIDRTGKIIIPIKYEEFGMFKEGKVKFTSDGKTGVIDSNDKVIFNADFYEAQQFSEGRSYISTPGDRLQHTWALVDDKGNFLTDHKFKYGNKFSESLSSVKDDENWKFIDRSGNVIIDNNYRFAGSFRNGLAWVSKYKDDGSSQGGFINKQGEWVIEIDDFQEVWDLRLNKQMY